MRKLIPIIFALLGTAAGIGAALFLGVGDEQQATAATEVDACVPCETALAAALPDAGAEAGSGRQYVKMNNQFVIPVISEDRVNALVVAALSLDVTDGLSERIYQLEPKLRDVFLQVLLDHASIGGFDGQFTTGPRMERLRIALLEAGRHVLGRDLHGVLITEIARQDA